MEQKNKLNDYSQILYHYINDIKGTGFLALRDVPSIIQQYSNGKTKTLDFGCGAGRSTRFLKSLGLYVDGVDIDVNMINMAKKLDRDGHYFIINDHKEILHLAKYDIIFNLFVLFEFGDPNSLVQYLSSLHCILNNDGILISIVNSEYLFTKNWLSCVNDFDHNKNLKSGNIAKVKLPEQGNIELYDYYWLESDYIHFFKQSGFSLIAIHKPIGLIDDPYLWKDEYFFPPYSIYICKK